MNTEIQTSRGSIFVQTFIDTAYPACCDSLAIYSGPFIISLGNDADARKALIAALQEADVELDAAAEARKKDGVVA